MFIITPRLVKPMQANNYPLPTDSFATPNPLSLYFMGNMEGAGKRPVPPAPEPSQPAAPAAAPATPPAAPRSEGTTSTAIALVPAGKPLDEPPPSVRVPPVTTASPPPQPRREPARNTAAAVPTEDTAARIARIEATAARLAQARAAGEPGRTTSGGN
ncbi:hypothetical protein FQZ97_772490 [compost metagenome]